MKSICKLLIAVALFTAVNGCKKSSNSTTPAKPDYGTSPVSGVWTVSTDGQEAFHPVNMEYQAGGPMANDNINSVTLNSNTHKATFTINNVAQTPEDYTYTTIADSTFISFSPADPFDRTVNERVWVKNINTTGMEWVAVDPKLYYYLGPPGYPPPPAVYYAYDLTFNKK